MKMIELNHGNKFVNPFFPKSVLMKMKMSACRGERVNAIDVDTGETFYVPSDKEVCSVQFTFTATGKHGQILSRI